MASDSPDPSSTGQPRSSLYANLLNSDASSNGQTISRGPIVFTQAGGNQDDAAAKKNAALRFQPTKRPTPAQKAKPKPAFSKVQAAPHGSSDSVDQPAAAAPAKNTLADWTADDDDINGFYVGEKRQRGGRKKRKKNKAEAVVVQDWDDIYDPSRPNSYEDYRHSEERYREIREWKDRLYAHRLNKRRGSSEPSDADGRPSHNTNRSFAPPPNYSFAPPPASDMDSQDVNRPTEDIPPPPPPAVHVPNDATGDDAYARRMRLSGMPQPPATALSPPPPPPPPPPPTEPAAPPPPGTISRAPVRYQLPAAPADIPASEAELASVLRAEEEEAATIASTADNADADADAEASATDTPRSSRPGQRGFAERLMSKYGWTKGSGLGAAGTGIVNPLRVQVEKRKKRPDAEGGGFVGPAGKGRIIGSKSGAGSGSAATAANKRDVEGEGGDEQIAAAPAISEVVVLKGMLDGLDVDVELGEGNLMQEIGDECGEKYGRVERVFVDRSNLVSVPVFVKFTSQLSALRAVQALEGRIFNGNTIQAQYFDPEKFEAGIYE